MRQQADQATTISYKGHSYPVTIYSNFDKTDGFSYYTFDFGLTQIVISKFDGEEWKIANHILDQDLAGLLGKLL